MKKLFNYVAKTFSMSRKQEEKLRCNYSNNYYGDQYCQVEKK